MARIFSSSVNMFYLLRVQEIVRIPKTANNLGVDNIDAQCQEHRFVDEATVLPNFQDDTVKINNGVNSIGDAANLLI